MARAHIEAAEVPLGSLVALPDNAKRHDLPELRRSVGRWGYINRVVVNRRSGHVLGGNGRVEALAAMRAAGDPPPRGVRAVGGDWSVPVDLVDVPEEDEPVAALALNELTIRGGYDEDVLARVLGERLGADPSGAGLIGSGFDAARAGELLAAWRARERAGERAGSDPDEVPEEVETRCRPGDLWALGEHRIAVGDCRDRTLMERLLGGVRPRMVWTDPPYGVNYSKGSRTIPNDDLDEVGTEGLVRDGLAAVCSPCLPGASVYVACPPGTLLPRFIAAVNGSGFTFKHSLVWVKDAFVFGRCDFHYRHETVLYGWKEDAGHYFAEDRTVDSVFEVPRTDRGASHPTVKPVELVARMIRCSSRPGEAVADPFLGSGTTVLACEAEGRTGFGCEIDPAFADLSLARWERFTGRAAERLEG